MTKRKFYSKFQIYFKQSSKIPAPQLASQSRVATACRPSPPVASTAQSCRDGLRGTTVGGGVKGADLKAEAEPQEEVAREPSRH